jgi:hypothetical protein
MAKKRFPPASAKKKSTRVARPLAAKAHLGAHSKLVHGFLIDLAPGPYGATGGKKPPFIATASAELRRRTDARHEGPADDATFH